MQVFCRLKQKILTLFIDSMCQRESFFNDNFFFLHSEREQFKKRSAVVSIRYPLHPFQEGSYSDLMATDGGGLAKLMETLVDESDEETTDNEESKEESKDDGHAHATFGGVTDIPPTVPAFGDRPPRSSNDFQKRPSFLSDQISDSSAM